MTSGVSFILLAMLAASDAPVVDKALELEAAHHQVRRLDLELVSIPQKMPLPYLIVPSSLFTASVALVFPAIARAWTLDRMINAFPLESVATAVLWALIPVCTIIGSAVLHDGLKLLKDGKERKKTLTVERDAALQRVQALEGR